MPFIRIVTNAGVTVAERSIPAGATAKIQAAYGGTAQEAADRLLDDLMPEIRERVLNRLKQQRTNIDAGAASAQQALIDADMNTEWP